MLCGFTHLFASVRIKALVFGKSPRGSNDFSGILTESETLAGLSPELGYCSIFSWKKTTLTGLCIFTSVLCVCSRVSSFWRQILSRKSSEAELFGRSQMAPAVFFRIFLINHPSKCSFGRLVLGVFKPVIF